jgi:hypothetical protein
MPLFYEFRKRNARAILLAIISALVVLAWFNRFIQDDAFISFRYADNLARGFGLVWNPGERVEGYTNFLWTLLMGAVHVFHGDPVVWSMAIGLAAFAGSLFLTYRIALQVFQSDDVGLLAVILVGTNYTFSAYATGGLETSLHALLYLAVIYSVIRPLRLRVCRSADALKISLLLALAMLLRLDSAMLCCAVFVFAGVTIVRQSAPLGSKAACAAALLAPFAAIMALWFAWKFSYYGDILPNTFYVKVSSVRDVTRGFVYLDRFCSSYLLYPILLVSAFSMFSFFRSIRAELLLIFLVAFAWIAYVIKVGGDFMEFRFMVPVIPLFVILFLWVLLFFAKTMTIRAGMILLVLIGSVHHVITFAYDPNDGIESIQELHAHIVAPDEQWGEIGKVLGKAFAYDPRVSLATTAAGAIPYYARLTSIDMLGLNDKYIARFGHYFGRAAGHERIATLAYLKQREVNLIVSHPYVDLRTEHVIKVPLIPGVDNKDLPNSKAVEIPLDALYKVVILYLTPSAVVDSVIARERWQVHQIMKEQE